MAKGKIQNPAALRAEFRRFLGRARAAAVAGVDDGLVTLADGLRRRVPRGETGELADSIEVRRARVVRGGNVAGAVTVGSDHALAVEYGTSDRAADPFVRPTKDADGPEALAAVRARLDRM